MLGQEQIQRITIHKLHHKPLFQSLFFGDTKNIPTNINDIEYQRYREVASSRIKIDQNTPHAVTKYATWAANTAPERETNQT